MGPVLTKAFSKSAQNEEHDEDHDEDDDDEEKEEEQSASLLKIIEYLSTQKEKKPKQTLSLAILYYIIIYNDGQ